MSDEAQTQDMSGQAAMENQEAAATTPGESQQSSPSSTTSTTPAPSSAEAEGPASGEGSATPAAGAQDAGTQSSAATATADAGESNSGANSAAGDELHVQIAQHLEAIYQLARNSVENPGATIAQAAGDLKEHIGDVLHKIRNGMSVAEGELAAKLEALFHKL